MNKTEMLQALEAAVPPLRGKLHIERVLYKKAANKAYMSFLCDDLVREGEFLQVERTLKELFPQVNVALRIASPGLGEDFLSHLDKYQSVLTDFLRRLLAQPVPQGAPPHALPPQFRAQWQCTVHGKEAPHG